VPEHLIRISQAVQYLLNKCSFLEPVNKCLLESWTLIQRPRIPSSSCEFRVRSGYCFYVEYFCLFNKLRTECSSGGTACLWGAGRPEFDPQWGRISGLSLIKISLAVHASLVTASATVRLWQCRPDLSRFIQPFGACARVRGVFWAGVVSPSFYNNVVGAVLPPPVQFFLLFNKFLPFWG
jgi:hypothetical protein